MSKRILVVEDQEDDRQILRDLLTSADYEMMEAENGEEALAAVAKEQPDTKTGRWCPCCEKRGYRHNIGVKIRRCPNLAN
jgi:hypothetical protein